MISGLYITITMIQSETTEIVVMFERQCIYSFFRGYMSKCSYLYNKCLRANTWYVNISWNINHNLIKPAIFFTTRDYKEYKVCEREWARHRPCIKQSVRNVYTRRSGASIAFRPEHKGCEPTGDPQLRAIIPLRATTLAVTINTESEYVHIQIRTD